MSDELLNRVFIGDTPEQLDCGIMINGEIWSHKRIAKMQAENDALKAQVAQLHKAIYRQQRKEGWCEEHPLVTLCIEPPVQYLAEHDREVSARAIRSAFSYCVHQYDITLSAHERLQWYIAKVESGEVEI